MPKRVFYHYEEREEFRPAGMWRNVSEKEREAYALCAADLMRFPDSFRNAMMRALDEWPHSAEAVMTNPTMNHQAWFGHAGCFLATGSPEDATRRGWHQLDEYEQHRANAAADEVIEEWKRRRRNGALPGQVPMPLDGLSA